MLIYLYYNNLDIWRLLEGFYSMKESLKVLKSSKIELRRVFWSVSVNICTTHYKCVFAL